MGYVNTVDNIFNYYNIYIFKVLISNIKTIVYQWFKVLSCHCVISRIEKEKCR